MNGIGDGIGRVLPGATSRVVGAAALALAVMLWSGVASATSCAYEGQSHDLLADSFHGIGFTLCEDHFASGSDAHAAFQEVLDELNAVEGSDLVFYVAGWDEHKAYGDVLARDDHNRIDMGTCPADEDCSYTGRCRARTNAWGRINEFDVHFKSGAAWVYAAPSTWSGGGPYFHNYALHEIGHGLGFDHTKKAVSVPNIMGSMMGRWLGDRQWGLKAHDHGHIRYHYPDGSGGGHPDLVLTHYTTEVNSNGGHDCVPHDEADEALVGESFPLAWTRMNLGSRPTAASYRTEVSLSTDDVLDASDRRVMAWTLSGSVAASSTLDCGTDVTVPTDLAAGDYYVIMEIDADGDIYEGREDNNVLPSRNPVRIRAEIDLAVTDVAVSGPYEEHIMEWMEPEESIPGWYSWRDVPFSVTVQNLGPRTAFATELSLCYEDMWLEHAMHCVREDVPSLASGGISEVAFSVPIPIEYYGEVIGITDMTFMVDPDYAHQDVELDADRGNNLYFMRVDDDWFRPDYVVEIDGVTLSGGPATYTALFDVTVRNVGPEAADRSTLLGVRRENGTLLGFRAIAALGSTEEVAGQIEADGLLLSRFFATTLLIEADATDLLAEQDEDNNAAVITFGEDVDPDRLRPREWVVDTDWMTPIVDATPSIRIEPLRFVDFVAGSAAFVQEYFDHAGNGPFLPDAHVLTPSGEWQIGVDIFQRGVVDAGVRWVTPLRLPLARQEDRTVLQMP